MKEKGREERPRWEVGAEIGPSRRGGGGTAGREVEVVFVGEMRCVWLRGKLQEGATRGHVCAGKAQGAVLGAGTGEFTLP